MARWAFVRIFHTRSSLVWSTLFNKDYSVSENDYNKIKSNEQVICSVQWSLCIARSDYYCNIDDRRNEFVKMFFSGNLSLKLIFKFIVLSIATRDRRKAKKIYENSFEIDLRGRSLSLYDYDTNTFSLFLTNKISFLRFAKGKVNYVLHEKSGLNSCASIAFKFSDKEITRISRIPWNGRPIKTAISTGVHKTKSRSE